MTTSARAPSSAARPRRSWSAATWSPTRSPSPWSATGWPRTTPQPGFLLDGFPRNVPQAETLKKMLAGLGHRGWSVVLELVVDDDEVVRRLSGRRTCRRCGRVWHVAFDPPARDRASATTAAASCSSATTTARRRSGTGSRCTRADRAADLLLRRRGHPARHRRHRAGGRDHRAGAERPAPVRPLIPRAGTVKADLATGTVGDREAERDAAEAEPAIEIKTPAQLAADARGGAGGRRGRCVPPRPRSAPGVSTAELDAIAERRDPGGRARSPRSWATTATRRRSAPR